MFIGYDGTGLFVMISGVDDYLFALSVFQLSSEEAMKGITL